MSTFPTHIMGISPTLAISSITRTIPSSFETTKSRDDHAVSFGGGGGAVWALGNLGNGRPMSSGRGTGRGDEEVERTSTGVDEDGFDRIVLMDKMIWIRFAASPLNSPISRANSENCRPQNPGIWEHESHSPFP